MFEEPKGQHESGSSMVAGAVAFCVIVGIVMYAFTKFAHWAAATIQDVSRLAATSF